MDVSLTIRTLVPLHLMTFYLSVCLVACICPCELFVDSFLDEYVLFYLLLLFCNCHKCKPVTSVLLWKFLHINLNLFKFIAVTQDKELTGIQGVTWSNPCNFYAYVALSFRKHWLFYVLSYLTLNKIITINMYYLKQLWPAGLYNTEVCCDVGTEFYARTFPPSMAQVPLLRQDLLSVEALRTRWDTSHSVGLLWTSDEPNAENS